MSDWDQLNKDVSELHAENLRLRSVVRDLYAACQSVWLQTPFDSPERVQIVAAMHKAKVEGAV